MKTFIIIGLGRFGSSAAEKLYEMGHEVIVMDRDEDAVSHLADHCTHAAIGDAREIEVLRAAGAAECQCAIVAMGEDLAASVLITMNLKDLGCKHIICKAQNEMYQRALERVGADRVLIPERDMAQRLVQSLGSRSFLDYMELSGEYAIAEIEAPKGWVGKTLKELNVRVKHQVSVLAIREAQSDRVRMAPGAEDCVKAGEKIMVMGRRHELDKLQKL